MMIHLSYITATIAVVVVSSTVVRKATAFVPDLSRTSPFAVPRATTPRTVETSQLGMSKTQLSEIDAMCIMNTATYCLDEHCPVDEVDALINQLEDQRDLLSRQLDDLDDFLADLGVKNVEGAGGNRDVEELRGIMGSIAKVFHIGEEKASP